MAGGTLGNWYRLGYSYGRKGSWKGENTLVTTGSTQTDIARFELQPGETAIITARIMVQTNDGDTYNGMYHLRSGFYRAHDGDVVQIDDLYHDATYESNTSLNVDIVADTGNETIDVRVTGIASTTLYWVSDVEIILNRGAK